MVPAPAVAVTAAAAAAASSTLHPPATATQPLSWTQLGRDETSRGRGGFLGMRIGCRAKSGEEWRGMYER